MKKFKNLASILSILVLMTVLSPGLEANAEEVNQDKYNSSVNMQNPVTVTVIGLDANAVEVNQDEYNANVKMQQSEVDQINQKATLQGGLVYGSWFGGIENTYQMSLTEGVKILVVLTAAFVPFMKTSAVGAKVAASLASIIGYTIVVKPGKIVKVDRVKKYRQVTYLDGTFAYFQTSVGASVNNGSNLGSGETILSGGLY